MRLFDVAAKGLLGAFAYRCFGWSCNNNTLLQREGPFSFP